MTAPPPSPAAAHVHMPPSTSPGLSSTPVHVGVGDGSTHGGLLQFRSRISSYIFSGLGQIAHSEASREDPDSLELVLPYVPAGLLACMGSPSPLLQALRTNEKSAASATHLGSCIFIDIAGFSALARALTRSEGASASEKLTSSLNEYFLQLVRRLHQRGAEVLLFAGDAVLAFIAAEGGLSLAATARLALDAALDVRAIAFARHGFRLIAHTAIGSGEMQLCLLQGTEGAAQGIYTGDLIRQACEAQRASKDDEIILSAHAFALLHAVCAAEAIPPAPGRTRPLYRLVSVVAPPAPPPPPSAGDVLCACGAALPPDFAAAPENLEPFARELASLAPAVVTRSKGDAFWAADIRNVFVVFASFPELDVQRSGGRASHIPGMPADFNNGPDAQSVASPPDGGPSGSAASHYALRFGQVVRAVHRVAREFGGSVNKCFVDDKGASAMLGFGLPGGFSHEDDAERAARAAIALESWFASSQAPFACGIAGGRIFCGSLGAPCRREYAWIGDAVIKAARLMSHARAVIGVGPKAGAKESKGLRPADRSKARRLSSTRMVRGQMVVCDQSVVSAISERGQVTNLEFEELGEVKAKGFAESLATFCPRQREPGPASASAEAVARTRLAITARQHSTTCIGRDEELEQASGAVARVARGRGATLVVEGDAGYGKTLFLKEVQRMCAAKGVLVLRFHSSMYEESTPLWACRGLLASELNTESEAGLAADAARRGLLSADDVSLLWRSLFAASHTLHPDQSIAASSYRGKGSPAGSIAATTLQNQERLQESSYGGGTLAMMRARRVSSVAEALARFIGALEARPSVELETPAGTARNAKQLPSHTGRSSRPVGLLVDDAQYLDSLSWAVLRSLRDSCHRLLVAVACRPMASAPEDFLAISGVATNLVSSCNLGTASPATAGAGAVAHKSGDVRRFSDASSDPGDVLRRHPVDLQPSVIQRIEEDTSLQVVTVTLGALEDAAARVLFATLSAQMQLDWSTEAAENALQKAAGVPLFVVELCRQKSLGADTIGDTIQQLIISRIDQLPSQSQAVLKLASVIGAAFSPAAVQAIDPSGDINLPAVTIAFRQLLRAGLIKVEELEMDASTSDGDGDGDGRESLPYGSASVEEDDEIASWPEPRLPFDFSHALVKEAIYASMAEAHRRDAHRRAALWLEGEGCPKPALLAHHWKGAGDTAMTAAWLERAGAAAYSSNALPEARRLYEELVAVLEKPLDQSASAPLLAQHTSRFRLRRALATRTIAFIDFAMGHFDGAKARATACLRMLGTSPPSTNVGFLSSALSRVHLVAFLLRRPRFASEPAPTGPGCPSGPPTSSGPPAEPAPEDEEQVARLECLLLIAWVNMSDGDARGAVGTARGRLLVARAALLKATDLVYRSRGKSLHVAHARVLANLSGMLSTLGFKRHAVRMLKLSYVLADKLDDDLARASACFDHATQLATEGRLQEAALKFEMASAYQATHPFVVDSLLAESICLLFLGQFEAAVGASQRAVNFAKRSGNDSVTAAHELVSGFAAFLTGRDADVDVALERLAAISSRPAGVVHGRWPCDAMARLLRGVHSFRTQNDAEEMAGCVADVVGLWRRGPESFGWLHILVAFLVVDFALWNAGEARGRLLDAFGSTHLSTRRLSHMSYSSSAAGSSSVHVVPVPSDHSHDREAMKPKSRMASHPHAQDGPGKAEARWSWPFAFARVGWKHRSAGSAADGAAVAAERKAAALAREAAGLLEETCRQRLPALRPLAHLARAEGLASNSPQRRLGELQLARTGFAAAGLRPFEAVACVRLARTHAALAAAAQAEAARARGEAGQYRELARAERAEAALMEALGHASRIAAETGLRLPAIGRLQGTGEGAGPLADPAAAAAPFFAFV